METPKSCHGIITGRATLENWLKKHYPEFFEYLMNKYPDFYSMQPRLYAYYHNIDSWPVCPNCGKLVKFHGYDYGFGKYCSPLCAGTDKEAKEKLNNTMIEKYGETYREMISEKIKQTCLERYGVENSMQYEPTKEKVKNTMIERYGVDNAMKSKEIQERAKQTCLERYGVECVTHSEYYKAKLSSIQEKSKQTSIEKYGVPFPMQSDIIKERVNQSCLERYGVPWNCMREEAHNSRNSKSVPNCKVAEILTRNNIEFSTEFPIYHYLYDFKVGDILLEVDPAATHNINWSPYEKSGGVTKDYHNNKSDLAKSNNYRCIHLWEWEPMDIIIDMLNTNKKKIYARNCIIKEIKKNIADNFLEANHLQGSCRGQKIRLGLFYNDELVEVMTFGKPRYNKKYEYELLRLCTCTGCIVIGGSSKLFSYFKKKYDPETIISYCDKSKFDGNIYRTLGFKLINTSQPACHWFNLKTKQHITDNLLRKLGADKILKTSFGKGTSNEQIMLDHDFVQVYDCGQYIFEYMKQ